MSSLFLIHGDSGAFITDSHAPARSEVHLPSSPSLNPLLPGFWSPLHPAHTERGGSSDCCSSVPSPPCPPPSPSPFPHPFPLLSTLLPYLSCPPTSWGLFSLPLLPLSSTPTLGKLFLARRVRWEMGHCPQAGASQERCPPSLILSFQEHPLSVGV